MTCGSGIVRLPTARRRLACWAPSAAVVIVIAAGDGLLRPRDDAGGLLGGPLLLQVPDELTEVLPALFVQVEPVGRLGEAQIGVHTGHDDAGVDGQQLDADEGDPDVGIDHEPVVEDDVHDIGETAGCGALEVAAPTSLHGLLGHGRTFRVEGVRRCRVRGSAGTTAAAALVEVLRLLFRLLLRLLVGLLLVLVLCRLLGLLVVDGLVVLRLLGLSLGVILGALLVVGLVLVVDLVVGLVLVAGLVLVLGLVVGLLGLAFVALVRRLVVLVLVAVLLVGAVVLVLVVAFLLLALHSVFVGLDDLAV